MAVHEAAGDVLVQRVGEHGVADLGVGGVAADQLVPAGLGVEHRRPQLAARLDAGRGERLVGHAGRPRCRARRRRARRRAGGPGRPVSTSTLPPWCDGRRQRRGRRRSSSCRRRPSRGRAPSPCSPASVSRPAASSRRPSGHVQLVGEASATSATTAAAGGPGEQLGHVEHRQAGGSPSRSRSRWRLPTRRRASVTWAAASTWRTPGPAASTSSGSTSSRRSTTSAWRRSNSAGSTRLATIAGGHAGLAVEPVDQVDRLGDRHLLGRGDDDDAGARRVLEDVGHPPRLLADHADLDRARGSPAGRRSGRRCDRSPRRRRRRGRSGARAPRRRACRRRGSP